MNAGGYVLTLAWQVGSRVLTVAANLAVFVLVARHLGADALGRFSWVITVVGVFSVLAEFGTTPLLARDLVRSPDRAGYWGTFLKVRALLGAIALLPMAAVALLSDEPNRTYLALLSLPMVFVAARFFDPLFQVYERPFLAFVPSLAYAASYCLVAFAGFHGFASLGPVLFAYAASNLVYFILAYALSRRLLRPTFRGDHPGWRPLLAAAAPMGVSSLFSIVNSRADVFLLAHLRTEVDVGIYNAGYKFLDLAAIAAVLLVSPVIPIFSTALARGQEEMKIRFQRILEAMGAVLLPVAALTPLISSDLVRVVYGPGFLETAPVLDVLAWAGLLAFFAILGSALSVAAGIVKHGYWNTALAAAVNIALNLALIPRFSYLGSAWATLISEVLLVGICYAFLIRNFGSLFRVRTWGKLLAANGTLTIGCALARSTPHPYLAIAFLLLLYVAFASKWILGYRLLAYLRNKTPCDIRTSS